jgi:hypothetical protein
MKLFKRILLTLSFAGLLAAPMVTVATPQFVAADPKCDKGILTVPPWYRNLTGSFPECEVIDPNTAPGGLSGFIWTIVINVIEIGLNITGIAAFIFVIYGGFLFLTGGNNASQVEKARKTLIYAIVGLILSIASIGIINLLFRIANP